jgi:radical SAM enzyme (TIGR01210 family)
LAANASAAKLLKVTLASSSFVYPQAPADRTRWILSQRGEKTRLDSNRPYAFFLEHELGPARELLPTATIFLTNRECPWRCLMCDLWRNTTDETVAAGAIPAQIRFALEQIPRARQIKLYNSGSFFDPQAIPREDWPAIAALTREFERVIVECHPALISERCADFAAIIGGKLEIAMGLETANPDALEKLNKRMTIDSFRTAADKLREMEIDLRVFILVKPPFIEDSAVMEWTCRSIDLALECGASVISLIPTRTGNGAMDELAGHGLFSEPALELVEHALDYGIGLGRARVFADLWDLRRFSRCAKCFEPREARLYQMNSTQIVLLRVPCACQ